MMAAILNSAMLDSATAILDSDTLLSSLRFTPKHSHSTLILTQTHSFSLNFMMATILNSAILNSAILNSALLIFPFKLAYTCQDWFPPFAQKKLHSFILTQLDDGSYLEICLLWYSHFAQKKPHWFILPQLDDGSLLVFCHLGFWHHVFFSEIHSKTLSLSTLTLTQTNSIWFKLIHSHLTWWWQSS